MVISIQQFGFRIPMLARSREEIVDGHWAQGRAESRSRTIAGPLV
jgi:hypothetical protein